MARAATTLDPFNAVAEPKRRRVLELLAESDAETPVNDLVASLGWPQPMVSKHLGVLKDVGLVTMRENGRQRLYRINGERLRPIYDWTRMFEKFWTHQLDRIKERAERKAKENEKKTS
ncbi:MAG TPA: metalloregulator ArsR/SmtB family transcription factor [Tepidisphaeraceae bacterium]|jgi:DNA-binding transcriptional ArsR family regulator|nr:metalloregulator ArsR/SmtB family transcription factor [Tepidisphaeraceae bacterium]